MKDRMSVRDGDRERVERKRDTKKSTKKERVK